MSKTKLRRRFRVAAVLAALLYCTYVICGFLLVPGALKRFLPPVVKESICAELSFGSARFNPFTLSVKLNDAALATRSSRLISLAELEINAALSSIFRRALVLQELSIREPRVEYSISESGSNFDSLCFGSEEAKAPPTSEPLVIAAQTFRLVSGDFLFDDRLNGFKQSITGISLLLESFSTERGLKSTFRISGVPDGGEALEWQGVLSVDPFSLSGEIELRKVRWLNAAMPFLSKVLRLSEAAGTLTAKASYHIGGEGKSARLQLTSIAAQADNTVLSAGEPAGELLSVQSMKINSATVDLLRKSIEIEKFSTSGGKVQLVRDSGGQINVSSLLVEKSATPPSEGAENNSPWSFSLKEAALENYAVSWSDGTLTPNVQIGISDISVSAVDVNTESENPVKLKVAFRADETASFHSNGKATFSPLAISLDAGIDQLPLDIFSPYSRQAGKIDFESGELRSKGKLDLLRESDGRLDVRFSGSIDLARLSINRLDGEPVVAVEDIDAGGVKIASTPLSITIEELRLKGPKAGFEKTAEKKSAANAEAKGPKIDIDKVFVEGGEFAFVDSTVSPPFKVKLTDIAGSLDVLSTDRDGGKADLVMKVDSVSPLTLKGDISPLQRQKDVNVRLLLEDYQMPSLSPYSGTFLGRRVRKGKLDAEVQIKMTGRRLEANNHFVLEQFTFGDSVKSLRARRVPVDFAVSVLKDGDGKITLNLPVQGDLDSPAFSYRDLLFRALGNTLTAVVKSPLAMLSSIYGEGEELQFVDFPPGDSSLSDDEVGKLQLLAKLLEDRPKLRLEIQGAASSILDSPKDDKIEDEALRGLANERAKAIQQAILKAGSVKQRRLFLLDPIALRREAR